MPIADAATLDAQLREQVQGIRAVIGTMDLCKRAGVSDTTLASFLKGGEIRITTRSRLLRFIREHKKTESPKAADLGKAKESSTPVDPEPTESHTVTRNVYEETVPEEADPVTAPQRPAAPTLAGPNRVEAEMKLRGPADQVKRAAADMGATAGVFARGERGSTDPVRASAEARLEALLRDGGTAIRIDRCRPREAARIMDIAAPTSLGRIVRETEDKLGGGLYKIRAFPGTGDQPVEYQFTIPGAPLEAPKDPGSNGSSDESGPSEVEKIEQEIARTEAKKRQMLAEAELEEAKAKIKRAKDGEAPKGELTLDAVAKLITQAVDAAVQPLRAEKEKSSLTAEITGPLMKMIEQQNARIEAMLPKQKSAELVALEEQLDELRELVQASVSGRPITEEKDPLDMADRLLALLNKARGGSSGEPKENSDLIKTALEEILLQRLRGEDGGSTQVSIPETEEDWLKLSIKEIAPIFKQWLHDEMEIRKQKGQAMTKEEQASMTQQIRQAAEQVQQRLRSQQAAQPTPPALPPPAPTKPAQANAPPASKPPTASQAAQKNPPPPPTRTDRYPEAVDEALTTLIREIGEGRPDESEWLAIALDNVEEEVLDKICEVDDAEGLYKVLGPIADPKLIDKVKELAKADRLVKTYVSQGIAIIQNNWSRMRAGELPLGGEPDDGGTSEESEDEGREPPRV